tara:strand:+ start:1286 stop:1474 length:189 start_codon:yes stop_codon:yes gene_type:complete
MAKKLRMKSSVEPARPDSKSLTGNALGGTPNDNGKNKSVWQTMIDNSGFQKRHPEIVLKGKK